MRTAVGEVEKRQEETQETQETIGIYNPKIEIMVWICLNLCFHSYQSSIFRQIQDSNARSQLGIRCGPWGPNKRGTGTSSQLSGPYGWRYHGDWRYHRSSASPQKWWATCLVAPFWKMCLLKVTKKNRWRTNSGRHFRIGMVKWSSISGSPSFLRSLPRFLSSKHQQTGHAQHSTSIRCHHCHLRLLTSNCEPAFFMLAWCSNGKVYQHCPWFSSVLSHEATKKSSSRGWTMTQYWKLWWRLGIHPHFKKPLVQMAHALMATCFAAFFSWACCFACPRTMIACMVNVMLSFFGFSANDLRNPSTGHWRWNPTTATSRKNVVWRYLFQDFTWFYIIFQLSTCKHDEPKVPQHSSRVWSVALRSHAIPLTLKTPAFAKAGRHQRAKD